jgi:hypothetical protein
MTISFTIKISLSLSLSIYIYDHYLSIYFHIYLYIAIYVLVCVYIYTLKRALVTKSLFLMAKLLSPFEEIDFLWKVCHMISIIIMVTHFKEYKTS